jgi:hypothetical protein
MDVSPTRPIQVYPQIGDIFVQRFTPENSTTSPPDPDRHRHRDGGSNRNEPYKSTCKTSIPSLFFFDFPIPL